MSYMFNVSLRAASYRKVDWCMKFSKRKEFYVYALLDPRELGPFYYGHWKFDYAPFYIGKGKAKRAFEHLSGRDVRIFTARMSPYSYSTKQMRDLDRMREALEKWSLTYIGKVLPLTNQKDGLMEVLWDDRAVGFHFASHLAYATSQS